MKTSKSSLLAPRWAHVKHLLKQKNIDGLLLEKPEDIFYLTHELVSKGTLFISEKQSFFFVDSRYFNAQHTSEHFKQVLLEPKVLEDFLQQQSAISIAIDPLYLSAKRLEQLQKQVSTSFVWIENPLKLLRLYKDAEEITLIKEGVAILKKAFLETLKHIHIGVTEGFIAKQFVIEALLAGADKLSFEPIVAFGPHAALPHYRGREGVLQKGDLILMDIGIVHKEYATDMTRMIALQKPNSEQQHMLDLVEKSFLEGFKKATTTYTLKDVDEATREVFRGDHREKEFLHSLGHGVGLELHEAPFFRGEDLQLKIKDGLVFTLEPGLYLSGQMGVRMESMILIQNEHPEDLMHDLPKLIHL